MVIDDKSWTLLELHEPAFYIGLEKFIDHCKPLVNSAGKIRCPCKSCRTILWVSIKHLSDHIMRHGFDLCYKIWVHHDEPDLPPPPPEIDNTRQPQMSDMTTLLNDLSYIPQNNKHNEPTQGDIRETSNEPTQDTRNEFEELYASANEELYPGCDYVTRLDFMAKFTYFKVKGKLTDSIFNEILEFFQNVFPISKRYKLPPSYYAIKKTFKTIGLWYESIYACEHDCCLFQGDDNKDLDLCSVYNTSRWKDSNTLGKKVPKKVLRYFSIIPRLQRLYKSSHTAKEMIWHAIGKCTEPESSFMLTLLIPGPKFPGKNIDVYLRPLIEDLKVLWDRKGVETLDVASGHKFNIRAMVLWTINDFLDRSSLSGWSGQGYKANPTYDMLKAQIKAVDILCDLELIYPPALFDIMIHLVIHLPLEALEGGPIRPRWMFPFERYIKKLKDPPPPTCQFQVFRSVCKKIGLRSVIRFDAQELKKVKWYVLHNSPGIDTYRSQFKRRDERRATQNSGICSPGLDGEMYHVDVAVNLKENIDDLEKFKDETGTTSNANNEEDE
nr:hypothetical protein [Tanacetum cinerariifolium]